MAPPFAYAACLQTKEPGRLEDGRPGSGAYMEAAKDQGKKDKAKGVAEGSVGGPVAHEVAEGKVGASGYLDCAEGAQIDEVSRETRKALNYIARSGDGNERCYYCAMWQPPAEEQSLCGGCKLFSGPVNANGWCSGFAPRAT